MSNGYGGGSSGSSTGSGQRVAAPQQSRVNTQGQVAPEGFHYMPDGSLMSDEEHARLYSSKTIKGFDLDLSDLSAVGEARVFNITGDADGEFILEVKNNANGNYYNFATNKFQTTEYKLEGILTGGVYSGQIQFPSTITTDTVNGAVSSGVKVVMDTVVANTMAVGDRVRGNTTLNEGSITVAALDPDGDNTSEFSLSSAVALDDGVTLSFASSAQYDIYLYAKPGTKHVEYNEFRFSDNSIDLNSSIGSNSLMLQKVIYQYADVSLTIGKISPSSTIEMTGSGHTTKTIVVPRGKSKGKVPFSIKSIVSTASKAYQILKQPDINDILGKKDITIGSAPETLPNENIYPTARTAFTGDDVNGAVTSGSVVRMDNTDLSAAIAVGDKITSPTTTGTIDGNVADGDKVILDQNVATIMAVGDQVTGCAACNSFTIVVKTLNPDGDNAKEFDVELEGGGEASTQFDDGKTLTFSSKVNRKLTTVTVVETSGTATDFTMSNAIQFRDDQPLTFTPQANYQWPVDDISGISLGAFVAPATNVASNTILADYSDTTILNQGTASEQTIVNYQAPFKTTGGQKPTITNGVITTQPGSIVFDQQQALLLASDTISILGAGQSNILSLSGFELRITDLKISLAAIQTTSTAVCNSTTLAVSSVNGILPNVSTVSGIGINAALSNPTVTARSATSGAGNLTLSTSQVLESGQTFTFAGAGQEATISGNIEIIKAGTSDGTIFFDMENLVSIT